MDYIALAQELQSAEDSLRARIEALYGKISTTDFSNEFKVLEAVHDKIISLHTSLGTSGS